MAELRTLKGVEQEGKTTGGDSYSGSPKLRLTTLLDTLVTCRMDLSRAIGHGDGPDRMGDARLMSVRSLLDTAIASTKDIIDLLGDRTH
jgi:hypothetical protein